MAGPPHHERIEDPTFRRAVDLLDAGNVAALRATLLAYPGLVHQHVTFADGNYFRSPTLLEFVAENPIRHGRLPANIVDVTRVILDAAPDIAARNAALELVATGCVPRECGVQIPLIRLLCEYGAKPDSACHAAAAHAEHEALKELIRLGAKVDLPVAAALGDEPPFTRLLDAASPQDRHLAFAFAAQFGHARIVRTLLDAGEDPDRFNPPGAHAHSTPLHQAALAGHQDVVTLLVERGASLDLKDTIWRGTPADWAAPAGRTEIESYLRDAARRRQPRR